MMQMQPFNCKDDNFLQITNTNTNSHLYKFYKYWQNTKLNQWNFLYLFIQKQPPDCTNYHFNNLIIQRQSFNCTEEEFF